MGQGDVDLLTSESATEIRAGDVGRLPGFEPDEWQANRVSFLGPISGSE